MKNRARNYARNHNTSISRLVERYLDEITEEDTAFVAEPGSWTDQLLGAVSVPPEYKEMDYKEIKQKELLKKYGR